ncbi:heme biosynthesis protein HemY [Shumkonia mesophila]|uniref:heme biosynthesis protein HemY n=1 Tax=Shumkonia mesophila TaxID=2838854 RepID=UPI0029343C2A|nr:heme biosynthesis HemY N-terminal domain-containing protein [Shumkonia mesophila]
MARILAYLIVLVALVGAAVWLADHPGDVSLDWQGWRIETSVAVLGLAVAAVAALSALLYRVWLFLRRMPRRVAGARRESRRRRGYLALTRGMVAVAAGDAAEARRQMKRADGMLGDPPLTMLLSAQALQLSGDEKAAEKFFSAMLARPETEFLGLRGLLMQALKRGDSEKALGLAERAYRLQPRSEWAASTLFDLEAKSGAWKAARDTLSRAAKQGLVSADANRERAAALDFQLAQDALAQGQEQVAAKLLRRVVDARPGFTPAVVRLARLDLDGGQGGRAASLIERAWAVAPHPDLAPLYWRARGADAGLARAKAAQRLARQNPDHPESHLAIAEAALDARLWGEARRHLGLAGGEAPPARVCRLMAELEESEKGDGAAARAWLVRATLADPDPAWVCGECGHARAEWQIRCEHCEAFASFRWQTPPHVARLTDGTATAPLALAPAAAPAVAEPPADAIAGTESVDASGPAR